MECHNLEGKYSNEESIRTIEADVLHANKLASSIFGTRLQMKLVYNQFMFPFWSLLNLIDCSNLFSSLFHLVHIVIYSDPAQIDGNVKLVLRGRKATIGQFYDVILPYLEQLCKLSLAKKLETYQDEDHGQDEIMKTKNDVDANVGRDEECAICVRPRTKVVLPDCYHEMCIDCYHKWSKRSKSCPFCRRSLDRVNSKEFWVLTSHEETLLKDVELQFYFYVQNLPKHKDFDVLVPSALPN